MSLRSFIGLALLVLAVMPASAGLFDERRAQCQQCHGDKGVSPTSEVPSLGGQPELYALFQLVAFREAQRKVAVMNDMMRGMSDDDLRAAAAFVGKLPAPPAAEAGEPARMARAKTLVEKNRCGFCHNADFTGHDQIPRLAHQREDYLIKALREYKSQKRFGSGAVMNEVVYPLTDGDLVELAYYMTHVR